MPESSVLDPKAIENLRALTPGDGDAFLREVAGIFLEDTPLRIAELDQSALAGNLAGVTRAAHSIKGSSANLGATALRAAAASLELKARTHGLGDVAAQIGAVKAEFLRTQLALRELTGT